VFLSDGYFVPGCPQEIVGKMAAANITLSTIGLGDANNKLLESFAHATHGTHYPLSNPTQIGATLKRDLSKHRLK
jgi:hypothetical protein